jgi:hypothetical protein
MISIRMLFIAVESAGSSRRPVGILFILSRYASTSAYSSAERLPGSFFGMRSRM